MAFFDEIAKKSGQIITFTSVATGDEVSFPAFINQFSDDYQVGWTGDTVFGRTDPIKHYTATTRRIQAGFDVLARNRETAVENFAKLGLLTRMMYPVYSEPLGADENNARTIVAAPLMRVKYANYIRSSANPGGLLGCMGGFSFNPDFAGGHFLNRSNEMVPLKFSLNFVFEPIHEKPLGFDKSGQFLDETHPWNQTGPTKGIKTPANGGNLE